MFIPNERGAEFVEWLDTRCPDWYNLEGTKISLRNAFYARMTLVDYGYPMRGTTRCVISFRKPEHAMLARLTWESGRPQEIIWHPCTLGTK